MFKVALINDKAQVPLSATDGSAGYDLFATEALVIPSNKRSAVSTGISVEFPSDHYLRIAPRSGLAYKSGIDVGAGVIDSDYKGEIKVILFNHSDTDFIINVGDRIAQMIYVKISKPTLNVVPFDELSKTERGEGGFGSTGV